MLEIGKTVLLIISALLPVVNPLGGSPVFLSLTRHHSTHARMTLARSVAINSFSLLIGSYLLGAHVLEFFGISLPVVQIGGGLVVISTGWSMLRRPDEEDERGEVHRTAQKNGTAPNAFYPLTLPLTVGPGTISVAITLGANAPYHHSATHVVILSAIIGSLVIAASIFLCYGFADRLERVIGQSAMNVILRLFTFLLICIGVQIFWNGASALITSVLLNAR